MEETLAAWRFGGGYRSPAWGQRQPGVPLAKAVPGRTARRGSRRSATGAGADRRSGEQRAPPAKLCAGVIVVEVGRARIRIEGSVDAEALRLVLERVGR